MTTELTDELRRSFEAQVADPPELTDSAGRAMRQGRSMRTRRLAVVGSVAAVLVLAGGVAVAREGLSGGADRPPPALGTEELADAAWADAYRGLPQGEPPRLDLLGKEEILTAQGRRVPVPPGTRAVRVSSGLLVWTVPGTVAVLGDDGRRRELGRTRSEVVVSGDGKLAGWLEDDLTLRAAVLTQQGVGFSTIYDPVTYVPGTPPAVPAAWAGDWLLLRGGSAAQPTIGWWRPTVSSKAPDGGSDLSLGTFAGTPYGQAPDGRHALVILGRAGDDGCLATMTLTRTPVIDNKWCHPGLDATRTWFDTLTPDGRWLETRVSRAGGRTADQLEIVDVAAALAAQEPFGRFAVPDWLVFTGAWAESRDVLLLDTGRKIDGRSAYVRCEARAERCERVLAPAAGDFTLVRRHGY